MSTAPQIRRSVLQRHPLPQFPGWESRMVLLEYPPRAAAAPHYHPEAGPNYVVSGEVLSQWEGGEAEVFGKGESFMDWKDVVHVRVENASESEWMRVVAFYVIRVEEPNVVVVEEGE